MSFIITPSGRQPLDESSDRDVFSWHSKDKGSIKTAEALAKENKLHHMAVPVTGGYKHMFSGHKKDVQNVRHKVKGMLEEGIFGPKKTHDQKLEDWAMKQAATAAKKGHSKDKFMDDVSRGVIKRDRGKNPGAAMVGAGIAFSGNPVFVATGMPYKMIKGGIQRSRSDALAHDDNRRDTRVAILRKALAHYKANVKLSEETLDEDGNGMSHFRLYHKPGEKQKNLAKIQSYVKRTGGELSSLEHSKNPNITVHQFFGTISQRAHLQRIMKKEWLSEEILSEGSDAVKKAIIKHVKQISDHNNLRTHDLDSVLARHSVHDIMKGARAYCDIHNPDGSSFAHAIIDDHLSGKHLVQKPHDFVRELAMRSAAKVRK